MITTSTRVEDADIASLLERVTAATGPEAKAAAQADYEARVLAALSPPVTTPAESGGWQWRDDLDAVPRDRKFLIKYSSGDVTLGGYLDNSQTKWPWQGIRPYESGRAERIGDSIVAWMELPSANLSGGSAPVASPNGEHLRPLADRGKSATSPYPVVSDVLSAKAGDGWVLVPREPTEAMLNAAMDDLDWWQGPTEVSTSSENAKYDDMSKATIADAYRAMIAAAPAALVSPPDNGEADSFPKTLGKIHEAVDSYVEQIARSEYGERSAARAFDAICSSLGRNTVKEADARRAALQSHNEGSAGK